MAFTLYSLLQAALLCVNEPGIKSQLTNLIRSVRTVMRVPLIIVNSVAIVLILLFG
ncbi:hypothetical protein H1C71_004182 [Ictidomys tridecemlineatus]|uniref:Immediate early response 3-interacting protein 1 n=1 Tax=Ictidomys tridecemlineatus TaxID=43179 RepID=A0A287D0P2_ICTTR|nr:hypothetical protein H1C71_004182 [Ictidomys tridecemlineatus]